MRKKIGTNDEVYWQRSKRKQFFLSSFIFVMALLMRLLTMTNEFLHSWIFLSFVLSFFLFFILLPRPRCRRFLRFIILHGSALRRTPKFRKSTAFIFSIACYRCDSKYPRCRSIPSSLLCSLLFILWAFNDSSHLCDSWCSLCMYVRFIFAQVKLSVVIKHIIAIKWSKRKQQQQQRKVHPKKEPVDSTFAADQPNNNNGMN